MSALRLRWALPEADRASGAARGSSEPTPAKGDRDASRRTDPRPRPQPLPGERATDLQVRDEPHAPRGDPGAPVHLYGNPLRALGRDVGSVPRGVPLRPLR